MGGLGKQLGWGALVGSAALANYFLGWWVTARFGLCYVQTVIYVFAGVVHLAVGEKNEFYFAFAFARAVNGVSGWLEATQCDNFYRAIGGHMWYDALIPLSLVGILLYARSVSPKAKTI